MIVIAINDLIDIKGGFIINNGLKLIDEREVLGRDFRIYGDLENPLFLAKDVAAWIEHTNSRMMLQSLDEGEKVKIEYPVNNPYGVSQKEEQWFLTEDGLYEVLMQSRKPIAREFKKQVKIILKEIRKHGVYATNDVLENMLKSPDFGIKILTELKAERERRTALEHKVMEDMLMIEFANAVEASDSTILIGDLAKILRQNGIEIGQNRLFSWLRENDYLMKAGSSRNMPTQRSMEIGLFEVVENVIALPRGKIHITKTTRVTGKGQVYFINIFKEHNIAV